jgi:hypothetical protein
MAPIAAGAAVISIPVYRDAEREQKDLYVTKLQLPWSHATF